MGRTPVPNDPSASKAATDRSIEVALEQVGQSSATVTVTVLPFAVLVITTCLPQSGDALPEVP
jgi:hypothetical protein